MRPSEPWSSSSSLSRPSLSSLATSTSPSSVVDESTSNTSPPTSEDGGISPFASPSVSPPRGSAFSSSKYSAPSASRSMGGEGKRFEEEAALALAAEEGTLRIPPTQQGGDHHSLRNAATAPTSARRSDERERGGSSARTTRAFASTATSEPTWDDVLSRAKLVLKQWKRVYETEGLTGYVCRFWSPGLLQFSDAGTLWKAGIDPSLSTLAVSPTTFGIARCSRVARPSVQPGLLRPLSILSAPSSP